MALTVAIAAVAAHGCSREEPIDIRLRCEIDSEAALVQPGSVLAHSVGVVGEHAFISWELPIEDEWPWVGRWHDARTLEPASDVVDFGWGPSRRPQWIADGGGLEGYLLADPERRPLTELPESQRITSWRLTPPPMLGATSQPIAFDALRVTFSVPSAGVSWEGTLPSVRVGDRVISATSAIASECGAPLTNSLRLNVFGVEEPVARPIYWAAHCSAEPNEQLEVGAPWMVPSSDGFGLFFRPAGPVPQPVRYVRVLSDYSVPEPPRVVGLTRDAQNTFSAGGQQVRAARIGDAILFAEGTTRADWCSAIRIMDVEGRHVRSAPWQLPCVSDPSRIAFPVEMAASGDYVALLWAERSRVDSLSVTADVDWREDVKLAMLTPEGRLASEPVSILFPGSTALRAVPRTEDFGPYVDNFFVSLAPDAVVRGDAHVHLAAWRDVGSEAPGLYARRIRCTPLE